MATHNLKAVIDGRTYARSATRPFSHCWLDSYGREHWTLDASRVPPGMKLGQAVGITAVEYRAIKADARKPV